jgi:hypothetical protein
MIAFIKALFSENSDVSMVRFMSLLSLIIGGYLAGKGLDASVSIFVISAFGAKVLQKQIEVKKDK